MLFFVINLTKLSYCATCALIYKCSQQKLTESSVVFIKGQTEIVRPIKGRTYNRSQHSNYSWWRLVRNSLLDKGKPMEALIFVVTTHVLYSISLPTFLGIYKNRLFCIFILCGPKHLKNKRIIEERSYIIEIYLRPKASCWDCRFNYHYWLVFWKIKQNNISIYDRKR